MFLCCLPLSLSLIPSLSSHQYALVPGILPQPPACPDPVLPQGPNLKAFSFSTKHSNLLSPLQQRLLFVLLKPLWVSLHKLCLHHAAQWPAPCSSFTIDSRVAKGLQRSAQPPTLGLMGLLFVVAVVAIVVFPLLALCPKQETWALVPFQIWQGDGMYALRFYVLVVPKLRYTK